MSLKSWFALWILKFNENKARAICVSRGRRWTGTYRIVEWTVHPVRESRKLFGIIVYRLQGELV